MKTRKKKVFPMDGPPRHVQALMESPRRNAAQLRAWLKENKHMRPETKDCINQALAR